MGQFIETETIILPKEGIREFFEWVKEALPGVLTTSMSKNQQQSTILCLFTDEREYMMYMLSKDRFGEKQ